MSRCRIIGLLSLAVLIVAAAELLARRPREPVYQGKRLSEWLSGLAAGGYPVGDTERTRAKQLALQLGTNAPDWLVNAGDSIGQIPDQESRALDAVRQIGTKGIPALLGMVNATTAILTGEESARFWIALLLAYDVVFTTACWLLFETVLEAE